MPDWPHAPVHQIGERGAYMVTGGTFGKKHFIDGPQRLSLVRDTLLELANEFGWRLQAWAILSNHYHFIGVSPEDSASLKKFISKFHGITARQLNRWDAKPKRRIWYQYYDSRISYQKSYLARLKYVHQNPVKHNVIPNAMDYAWCSASWFRRNSESGLRRTVDSFKIDNLNVYDDYEPQPCPALTVTKRR